MSEAAHLRDPVVVGLLSSSMIAFAVIGTLGNMLAIICAFRNNSLRTVGNRFIINLAVSDFFISTWTMTTTAICVIKGDWVLGDIACDFGAFTDNVMLTASVWTLGFCSLNRYFKITKPFQYSKYMNNRNSNYILCFVWFIAIATAGPPLVGWNSYTFSDGSFNCALDGVSFPKDSIHGKYFIYLTALYLPIPIFLMSFSYTHIFLTARQQKKAAAKRKNNRPDTVLKAELERSNEGVLSPSIDLSEEPGKSYPMSDEISGEDPAGTDPKNKSPLKTRFQCSIRAPRNGRLDRTTMMIIIIIGMTLGTQIPVCFVATVNYFFLPSFTLPTGVLICLHWLLLFNSTANPIIYGAMNPPFRKAYIKFYKNVCFKVTRRYNSSSGIGN